MIRTDVMKEYERILSKYPNADKDFMHNFMRLMPEEAMDMFEDYEDYKEYGCHIATEKLYNRYINKLNQVKWSYDDVISVASPSIDFAQKDYYEYDFAFLMNYLYCLFKEKFTDYAYYVFMTQKLLENPMMPKSDDLAYHLAEKL